VIGEALDSFSSLLLRPDGQVEQTIRATTGLTCDLPLLSPLYPQVCSLTFDSLCNDEESVVLSWGNYSTEFLPTPPHLSLLAHRLSSTSTSKITVSLLTKMSFMPLLLKSYLSYIFLLLPPLLSLLLPTSLSNHRLLLCLLPFLLLLHLQHSMQNTNLLFALGSLVFSLLLFFCNILLIVFNEGEAGHQSGQVIVFVELLMMGRTKTQVREDLGGCSRLRDKSANLDQVAKVVFPVLVLIFCLVYFSTALNYSQEQYAGFIFLNKSEI